MDSQPARPPRRLSLQLGDGAMSALEFGDPARPVDVVFAHANGFNAQAYRQGLAPLGHALRVVALDLRGHGLSELPADPRGHDSWRPFARDILRAAAQVADRPVVLSGHSMGATAALLAAAEEPARVRGLVLFEPVFLPRWQTWGARLPFAPALVRRRLPWARSASARRSHFPSAQAAFSALRGRGVFRGWPDAALADYVAGGVRARPDGEVDLACAPAWEAANYAAQRHDPYVALARVRAPVRILKAERNSTCRLAPGERRPGVTVEVVPDTGHFLPVERPDVLRDALLEAAAD